MNVFHSPIRTEIMCGPDYISPSGKKISIYFLLLDEDMKTVNKLVNIVPDEDRDFDIMVSFGADTYLGDTLQIGNPNLIFEILSAKYDAGKKPPLNYEGKVENISGLHHHIAASFMSALVSEIGRSWEYRTEHDERISVIEGQYENILSRNEELSSIISERTNLANDVAREHARQVDRLTRERDEAVNLRSTDATTIEFQNGRIQDLDIQLHTEKGKVVNLKAQIKSRDDEIELLQQRVQTFTRRAANTPSSAERARPSGESSDERNVRRRTGDGGGRR